MLYYTHIHLVCQPNFFNSQNLPFLISFFVFLRLFTVAGQCAEPRFRLYLLTGQQNGQAIVLGLFGGVDVQDQTDPGTGLVTARFTHLDYALEGGAPAIREQLTATGAYLYPDSRPFGSDQYIAATDNWQSPLFTGFQDGVLYRFTLNWTYTPAVQSALEAQPPEAPPLGPASSGLTSSAEPGPSEDPPSLSGTRSCGSASSSGCDWDEPELYAPYQFVRLHYKNMAIKAAAKTGSFFKSVSQKTASIKADSKRTFKERSISASNWWNTSSAKSSGFVSGFTDAVAAISISVKNSPSSAGSRSMIGTGEGSLTSMPGLGTLVRSLADRLPV